LKRSAEKEDRSGQDLQRAERHAAQQLRLKNARRI